MEYVVAFLVYTTLTWITLLVVLPIAQKLADFGLPPLVDLLWQVALVSGIYTAVGMLCSPLGGFLGWLIPSIIFWVMMVKWFHVDLFGAIIIVVVNFIVGWWIWGLVVAALMSYIF
jgi:hypothetical protein